MRKLRISLASRTVKVDALQARNQPEIDLIVAQNSAAIAAFRLVQSQDKNATDRVAAASRLDETIEKLTVAMVRIKIADSRDLSQDRLQTEAQLQIVADSSLTEELQRAYDLAEIARNAALTKLLESEGARVRRIAQTGDFRGLVDCQTALQKQIETERSKDGASTKAARHAAEIKKAIEAPELRSSRQALAVALRNAAESR